MEKPGPRVSIPGSGTICRMDLKKKVTSLTKFSVLICMYLRHLPVKVLMRIK